MTTPPPPSRKLHIIRIFGTNKNKDVLQDIWADLERIERAKNAYDPEITDGNWQGDLVRIKWHDDPNADDYLPDGPDSRKQTILKLCPPETVDFSDPDEWIPLPIIDNMRISRDDQGRVVRFLNNNDDRTNNARQVEVRRVAHYDTSIDDEVQADINDDPTIKVWVLPAERYDEYVKNEDSKDKDQFVLVEYIQWLKTRTALKIQGDGSAQGKQVRVLSQYLIDNSDEPTNDEAHGNNDINPPYRMDPYQNIININWGGAIEVLPDNAVYTSTNIPTKVNRFAIVMAVRIPTSAFDAAVDEDGNKRVTIFECGKYAPGYLNDEDGFDNASMTPGDITVQLSDRDTGECSIGGGFSSTIVNQQAFQCGLWRARGLPPNDGDPPFPDTIVTGPNQLDDWNGNVKTDDSSFTYGISIQGSGFKADRWNLVMFSFDTSIAPNQASININNLQKSKLTNIKVSGTSKDLGRNDGNSCQNQELSDTGELIHGVVVTDEDLGIPPDHLIAKAWDINTGGEMGFPTILEDIGDGFDGGGLISSAGSGNDKAKIEYGRTWVWFDKPFADWTDDDLIALFLQPNPDTADVFDFNPDDAKIEQMLGAPDFAMEGGKTRWLKNQGSLGGDLLTDDDELLKNFSPPPTKIPSDIITKQ